MNIVYQIKTPDTTAYAGDINTCDALCNIIISNGGMPRVRRMRLKDVPMSDIALVNELRINNR